MPTKRSRRRSTLALALLLLSVIGAAPPPITLIEIVPYSVFVRHDGQRATTFELEARLWTGSLTNRRSITETQGYTNPNWTSDQPWLTVTRIGSGFRATATIASGLGATGTATVRVEVGGRVSEPIQVVVAPAPVQAQDFLDATYEADKPPDAVVANGIRNTADAPCSVTLSPFVTGSALGTLVAPCTAPDAKWGTAVMSVDHRLRFTAGAWTASQDIENAGNPSDLLRIPVALRIMVGDDALSESELASLRERLLLTARADISAANGVLAETRSGVQLTETDASTVQPLEGETNDFGEVVILDCSPGDETTSSYDYTGVLNLYYVNSLAGYRGRLCTWHEGRKQPVIYIGKDDHLQSTLAHEVGHALGLTLPYDGHIDYMGGLDVSNVMTSGYSDVDPGGRRRLSVGQIFRMNVDSASWLNWASDKTGSPIRAATEPRLACQCGEADPAGRCPRLQEDVAIPSGDPAAMYPWACFDRLQIAFAPSNEVPTAILGGRRWRAAPTDCSSALPGWAANHFGGIYVAVDNLDRPGSCGSWAAIFFRRKGARFVNLTEPNFLLTPVSDEVVIPGAVPDRVKLLVHVFNSTQDQGAVDRDIAQAKNVFGPDHRTGVLLQFAAHTNACPLVPPPPRQLHLCYVSGMTSEATQTGRRIKVGMRKPSTVSHFIGRALGLSPLGPNDPALPDNIMRSVPAERGKKLTLAQVYRMNAFLGVLPGCSLTPCPPLDLDVLP